GGWSDSGDGVNGVEESVVEAMVTRSGIDRAGVEGCCGRLLGRK
nr:hypothetical protein [Tanacetum cinerariifolium]